MTLDDKALSGILTLGGTILGTSRDKPHKMPMGGEILDMRHVAVENVEKHQIECLVCLGGGGTQKNAMRLHKAGIDVLTLPKTIDNDVAETDITFGFDTAMTIATDAIDRLHTTATSHHRIIVCEIMGHNSGWLALGAGISGGADVILIPEIPYDLNAVAEHLLARRRNGKRFSIIAVAEGAMSIEEIEEKEKKKQEKKDRNKKDGDSKKKKKDKSEDGRLKDADGIPYNLVQESKASRLTRQLQKLTGIEARVTALGHVQRGGIPTATDRMYSTLLGTKAAALLAEGTYNVMVAVRGTRCVPVPLERVAGKKKTVPPDHPWVEAARLVGTCMG